MKHFIRTTLTSLAVAAGLVFALVPFATPASALDVFKGAQQGCSGSGSGSAQTALCGATQSDDAPTIIKNVINLMLLVIGMIAVIMIIIGGIRYVTSNGDSNQISSAKNTILYAVVGLIIAIMAFAIVDFVIAAFTGGAGGNGANGSGGGTPAATIPPTQNPTSGTSGNPTTSGGNGGGGGTSPTPTPTYTYRNGSYAASGSFNTPAGVESIRVTLTIQNDRVTATTATDNARNATSRTYTDNFISSYSQYVIGQPLGTLSVGKIAGASLTPNGFNAAVSAIRQQAL